MTTPFRPNQADLDRIGLDVVPVSAIQDKLVQNHPKLTMRDRVAHQYQVAGGKVLLRIAERLPVNLAGVGLFEPNTQHTGIGRISTGAGCPHLETDADFLGLMVAFQTRGGHRVDFLTINEPTSPTDTHPQFVKLLDATADAAGAEPPESITRLILSLTASLGPIQGMNTATHVGKQTSRTALSSTAYQTYWTGIVEAGGVLGKFTFVPVTDENGPRALTPGERYLSDEWRQRQARGDIVFALQWLPFIDEQSTSTIKLTEQWQQRPQSVAQVIFPRADAESEDAQLWVALAAELGANAGNWVADAGNTIAEPGTEFTCARKFAYRRSQAGRGALAESAYAHVFRGEPIGDALATELRRRRSAKQAARHMDMAP
jgi:hypothetical protein